MRLIPSRSSTRGVARNLLRECPQAGKILGPCEQIFLALYFPLHPGIFCPNEVSRHLEYPRRLNPCPTVERVLLILFFLTCFEAMKHSTCFILITFAVKNVLYILNITCYILFFVYLWSCILNQGVSFQLICMKIKCIYIDVNTLHTHFLFFFLIITKNKNK